MSESEALCVLAEAAGESERGALGVLAEALFLLLDLRPPGRGRRVLLGAAAPRSTPFHPPPATPLALAFAWASLWPGQFLRKTDACHKPLGNRHHARPSSLTRTKWRLARRYVSWGRASRARSVEQVWTPQRAGQWHGRSPALQKEVWPVAAVRVERKGKGRLRTEAPPRSRRRGYRSSLLCRRGEE